MLRLLHADSHFVVVDKPSGLLVHPNVGDTSETAALHLVRDLIGTWVFPVHRLDRGTSGVLVFALSSESAKILHEKFEEGEIEKTYLALVRGVAPESGEIDHPIPRREGGPRVPALTHFRRVWQGNHLSLVEASPKTGRFHQVRRHLKHIHHPILGDANYGKGALNREFASRFGLTRLALHARSIAFTNPWSAEPTRIEAPLPDDLAAPFQNIGVTLP